MLAGFAAGYFYFHRAPTLTDKDTIVLAEFKNKTGDAVFDDTLRQGLEVQLEQSPYLSFISDDRIQQTLRQMGKPPGARLTFDVAREVCERIAGAAVVEGSISSLGSQYVLGLRATNCDAGNVLDEQQLPAARKEDVLNVLSQIAARFRTRAGEALATVRKHEVNLAEATTPSLEALKAYSASLKLSLSPDPSGAIPLLQRAIEIDPNFTMAYARLGRVYADTAQTVLSAENTRRAYELRSQRQRRGAFLHYQRLRFAGHRQPGKGATHRHLVGADLSRATGRRIHYSRMSPRRWVTMKSRRKKAGGRSRLIPILRPGPSITPGPASFWIGWTRQSAP